MVWISLNTLVLVSHFIIIPYEVYFMFQMRKPRHREINVPKVIQLVCDSLERKPREINSEDFNRHR